MFGLRKGGRVSDDAKQMRFVELVTDMLKIQMVPATGYSIEDGQGRINRKAIGYIYGFIDAALQRWGKDMTDPAVGVPFTYQVMRRLFPGCEEKYTKFLVDNIGKDKAVMLGMMHGGQQYLDFTKPDRKGVPMGLGRYLVEGDQGREPGPRLIQPDYAVSESDSERFMKLIAKIADQIGEAPITYNERGEVFVHPRLAKEIAKPENQGLKELLLIGAKMEGNTR